MTKTTGLTIFIIALLAASVAFAQEKKEEEHKAVPPQRAAPQRAAPQQHAAPLRTAPQVAAPHAPPQRTSPHVATPRRTQSHIAAPQRPTPHTVAQRKAVSPAVAHPKATSRVVRQRTGTSKVAAPSATVRKTASPAAAPRVVTSRGTAVTASRLRAAPARGAGRTVIRGQNYSVWRSGYRVRHGSGWRTFVALSTLGAIAIGSNEYYPYAYVSAPEDYCQGLTEDGCRLNWEQVQTEEGDVIDQCVAYCPWR